MVWKIISMGGNSDEKLAINIFVQLFHFSLFLSRSISLAHNVSVIYGSVHEEKITMRMR
jgi:hypothetical protein